MSWWQLNSFKTAKSVLLEEFKVDNHQICLFHWGNGMKSWFCWSLLLLNRELVFFTFCLSFWGQEILRQKMHNKNRDGRWLGEKMKFCWSRDGKEGSLMHALTWVSSRDARGGLLGGSDLKRSFIFRLCAAGIQMKTINFRSCSFLRILNMENLYLHKTWSQRYPGTN